METALPNLHPALIHFPLALVPLAVALDISGLIQRGASALHRFAAAIWVLAALGAFVAWLAGRDAADGLGLLDPAVGEALNTHADAAQIALIAVALVAVARVVLAWKFPALTWARALVVALGAGATVQLMLAADHGGALVYQHGVAVAMPEAEEADCPVCETLAAGEIPPGSVLEADGTRALLLGEAVGDVQVTATLELLDFEGRVGVLHHWGTTPGGFVVDTRDGSAVLTATSGELHRQTAELGERVELATSALGSHYKGYVDGAVVTHGHTDAEGPGYPGILLDGVGRVRVVSITIEGEAPPTTGHDHGGHAH